MPRFSAQQLTRLSANTLEACTTPADQAGSEQDPLLPALLHLLTGALAGEEPAHQAAQEDGAHRGQRQVDPHGEGEHGEQKPLCDHRQNGDRLGRADRIG